MNDPEVPAVDDERAAREGTEAEARALAWARSAIGTPYGDTSVWTGVGSGTVPEPLYQLDGATEQERTA